MAYLNTVRRYWATLYCKGVIGIGKVRSLIVNQGQIAEFGVVGQVQRNATVDCKVCFNELFDNSVGVNECNALKPTGTFAVPPGCQCDAEKKINSLGLSCEGVTDWRFWRWDEDPDPYNGAAGETGGYYHEEDIEQHASQLCTGCQAHKVKVDTCCLTIKERGTFEGTAPLTDGSSSWGDWEPAPEDICSGLDFEQRRRLHGCRPCSAIAILDKKTGVWWSPDTRTAKGTGGTEEPWPSPYGSSIGEAFDNMVEGELPEGGWKAQDPAGNPYAEDNPETTPVDESTHQGVCYPGILAWGAPANYADTDEPDCVFYADGTSSCDPPADPCAGGSGGCKDAAPNLKYMSLPAPEWSKCALLVDYKAQSALFDFTLFNTYKAKYRVIALAPGFDGGAPAAPDGALYLGVLHNWVFGWGWNLIPPQAGYDSARYRFIYIKYDIEHVSWEMRKTLGTYQWQSNTRLSLPTSVYSDLQSKGVSQSGYYLGAGEVPFPSEQQIKEMARYRVKSLSNKELQDKIYDQVIFQVTSGTKLQWKSQVLTEADTNGVSNLNNVTLSPGEHTLNEIQIGKTGGISFGGNSLIKLCLGELMAGFNQSAYQKVQGIKAGTGYSGPLHNNLLPCPDSCCCGQANCVHCNVQWSSGTSFAEAEFYGEERLAGLVAGAPLTSYQVQNWVGTNGFSISEYGTVTALDWNNGTASTRIVWTK
jgi:hypothetical protein